MDQTKQDKYRGEIIESYLKNAFEYLGLYQYWGEKFKRIESQVKDYDERIKKAEDAIRAIKQSPDHHTVENRQKAKAHQDDINQYRKLIENVKKPLQQIEKKCIGCQENAVENLELAELFVTFKVKTPQEMKAAKDLVDSKMGGSIIHDDLKKEIEDIAKPLSEVPAPEPVVAGGESKS